VNELALFAGAGGGILGGKLLGWRTVCAVEIDAFCREVLLRRQLDGCLPKFPIWDDIRTFDGKPWEGCVDVISGGFPCQDISVSNRNAKGINGERSGLWSEMYRIICEIRPKHVLVENSAALTVRGLGRVIGDLAEAGFDSKWCCIRCADVGGNHQRNRIWVYAYTTSKYGETMLKKDRDRFRRIPAQFRRVPWWKTEPDLLRVDDGMAVDVDKRNHAIGNGQVPAVVRLAWETLSGGTK
jgi:DNA (cytosine-5)-methyltransferase 1